MNERDKIINERANIIDIIKRWHCAQSRDINGHTIWLTDDNERLADALIANGYGDVAEWKRRAEVAEKIVDDLVQPCLFYDHCNWCDKYDECKYKSFATYEEQKEFCRNAWRSQAEREIEEEERK